jgi:hypothetical protein
MSPLKPKLTCDTKLDLVSIKDFSKSQESIGDVFGTTYEKINMSQKEWREANSLEYTARGHQVPGRRPGSGGDAPPAG